MIEKSMSRCGCACVTKMILDLSFSLPRIGSMLVLMLFRCNSRPLMDGSDVKDCSSLVMLAEMLFKCNWRSLLFLFSPDTPNSALQNVKSLVKTIYVKEKR